MCQLEAGMPEDAAAHFTKALTLAPDLPVRPIAAYYLEKMGKPVPPVPKRTLGTGKPGTASSSATPKTGIFGPAPTIAPAARRRQRRLSRWIRPGSRLSRKAPHSSRLRAEPELLEPRFRDLFARPSHWRQSFQA